MWKSGTFDLEDINETLLKEIVFFDISYPAMGDTGCVIFFTKRGDEYVIGVEGTDWCVDDVVGLFPKIYEAYRNNENGVLDAYGFKKIGNWKIVPVFCGELLVREDYIKKFYELYIRAGETDKDLPLGFVRNVFGREASAPVERMVYIKNQKCWDEQREREETREKEKIENRLSVEEVPWIKYSRNIEEGHIRFWIRKNDDSTFSAYRWYIQEQKEQFEEGGMRVGAQTECYNLFLQKYENIDEDKINDFEMVYCNYVKNGNAGKFVRSYSTLEKAKEAVDIRNEWIGWGNVNKKNVHMIDYERLKTRMEEDTDIFIF